MEGAWLTLRALDDCEMEAAPRVLERDGFAVPGPTRTDGPRSLWRG